MKITLCGSIAFINEMDALRQQLEGLGYEVKMPPMVVPGQDGEVMDASEYYKQKKAAFSDPASWVWDNHSQRIRDHFNKVAWGDAVLIANYDKNNISYYIGPNTLMEMGLAFHFGKKIFLLNPVPDTPWKEEVLGMRPVVIDQQLDLIA